MADAHSDQKLEVLQLWESITDVRLSDARRSEFLARTEVALLLEAPRDRVEQEGRQLYAKDGRLLLADWLRAVRRRPRRPPRKDEGGGPRKPKGPPRPPSPKGGRDTPKTPPWAGEGTSSRPAPPADADLHKRITEERRRRGLEKPGDPYQ